MDDLRFAPTLTQLLDSNEIGESKCCWTVKQRRQGEIAKCQRSILRADVAEREILIRKVRTLLAVGALKAVTRFESTQRDFTSQTSSLLQSISNLCLCKRSHRSFSAILLGKWCAELEQLQLPKTQSAADLIRHKLQINDTERLNCYGHTREDRRCRNWISVRNRARAVDLIEDVGKAVQAAEFLGDRVEKLAELLLCARYHRDQAASLSEEWAEWIREIVPTAKPSRHRPSTPERKSTKNTSYERTPETPETLISGVWSRSPSAEVDTPTTTPQVLRRTSDSSNFDHTPLSRRTRGKASDGGSVPDKKYENEPQNTMGHGLGLNDRMTTRRMAREPEISCPKPRPTSTEFEPFRQLSQEEIMTKLKEKIMAPLLNDEKKEGFVYGFRREDNGHIKIGFTTRASEERIKEWNNSCHQNVVVLFAEKMPHCAKVERLLHKTFHNARSTEILVDGRCNMGRGCSKKHKEWIEVSLDRAKRVIGMWRRWIESRPYDNKGALKDIWMHHIHRITVSKLKSLSDPWRYWIDVTILETPTENRLRSKSTPESSIHIVGRGTKTETIIGKTDIKEETDLDLERHNTHLGLNKSLGKLSKRYSRGLESIKNETSDRSTLYKIPLFGLEDPFIAGEESVLSP